MKGYHDIVGDGGSRILEQVVEQRTRIADGLAGVRHLVAVGSGEGLCSAEGIGARFRQAAQRIACGGVSVALAGHSSR